MGEIISINALVPSVLRRSEHVLPATLEHRQLPAYIPAEHLPATVPASVRTAAVLLQQSDLPQARQLSSDDLIEQLLEPLAILPFLLGHSNSLLAGKDLAMLATAVAELVHRDFPAFRLAEVALAIRRGAAGEWKVKPDEVLLPSLPCIRHWLKSYHLSTRGLAINALQAATAAAQKALPAPNIEPGLPAWVAELARHVATTGKVPEPLDVGHVAYNWLKRIGALDGFKTRAQCDAMLRKESLKQAAAVPKSLEQYRQIQSFGQALRAGWPHDHPLAPSVWNSCRKRLLAEWLRYHAARGTDLATWLQDLARCEQVAQAVAS